MNTLSGAVQSLLRFVIFSVFAITAIVGVFVAWWLVILAAVVLGCYIAFMRFFGVGWSAPGGKVTLEGEYKVEREAGQSGRVVEADLDTSRRADNNQP